MYIIVICIYIIVHNKSNQTNKLWNIKKRPISEKETL